MHSPHNPDNELKQEWCRGRKQKDILAPPSADEAFQSKI
jgi:hypothetical protein